ncbi:hypothetical protein AURDEDRAFT_163334 [Auricularia subglabra TFB-10046 SS5]|nr:hypothetical protein AURDEDRAFT_163334 [Auricularia subglabra TFB-10046 SS5]
MSEPEPSPTPSTIASREPKACISRRLQLYRLFQWYSEDSSADAFARAQTAAKSLLVVCVGFDMLQYVRDTDTAAEAFASLQDAFRPKGFGTGYTLFKEFLNQRFSDFDTGATYTGRIEAKAARLKGMGIPVPDFLIVYVMLNGLDSTWEVFIQTLDGFEKNAMKPEYVKRRITNEWLRRDSDRVAEATPIPDDNRESRAMAARMRLPSGATSGTGRRPARPAAGPPRGTTGEKTCHRCRLAGHFAADCNIRLEGDRFMTDEELASLSGTAQAAPGYPLQTTRDEDAEVQEEYFSF